MVILYRLEVLFILHLCQLLECSKLFILCIKFNKLGVFLVIKNLNDRAMLSSSKGHLSIKDILRFSIQCSLYTGLSLQIIIRWKFQ